MNAFGETEHDGRKIWMDRERKREIEGRMVERSSTVFVCVHVECVKREREKQRKREGRRRERSSVLRGCVCAFGVCCASEVSISEI